MLIAEHFFLLYFFPICFFLHTVLIKYTNVRYANALIVVMSLIFYSTFSITNVGVFIFTLILDYIFAYYIFHSRKKCLQKIFLSLGIILNISLLIYFKYRFFIASSVPIFGDSNNPPWWMFSNISLLVPVGISFITFQRIAYIVDIYREKIQPEWNILKYATYASLFPHLIAGPIVRFSDIKNQLSHRIISINYLFQGMLHFTLGFALKVLIADTLYPFEQQLIGNLINLSSIEAMVLMVGFSIRIYTDFSGYTLMALGLAMLLGFTFPQNFNSPYRSTSIRDFWRRWNITLSLWLRDYVYIPLGGNRHGRLRTSINVMITMLIGGLWHGASWNFILWGGLHGAYQVVESYIKDKFPRCILPSPISQIGVFLLVSLTWLTFVFKSPNEIWIVIEIISKLSWPDIKQLTAYRDLYSAVLAGIGGLIIIFFFSEQKLAQINPDIKKSLILTLLFVVVLFVSLINKGAPFIYFQF